MTHLTDDEIVGVMNRCKEPGLNTFSILVFAGKSSKLTKKRNHL